MKIRLGELRKIIREALDTSGGLAAVVRKSADVASTVVYSVDDLKSAVETGDDDLLAAFYNNNVTRGYIHIARPDKPCNGAWEVHGAWGPGIGETLYDLGFALSPTGFLMPDRLGVLPPAVKRWKKQSGREMVALDDFRHPPAGDVLFHDEHHTDDPLDDCRMNKDGIDILNYAYGSLGHEKGVLDAMIALHEATMTGIASRRNVEDALFDSGRKRFREALV